MNQYIVEKGFDALKQPLRVIKNVLTNLQTLINNITIYLVLLFVYIEN